jgi:hypothetical protein
LKFITSTAVILCTCTIACVVIKMLLPQGKTQKTMNLIITAFLIIVMISPIINLFSKSEGIEVSTPDEAKIMEEYNSKVLSVTQDNIRNSLCALLKQNSYEYSKVYVSVKTSQDNGIIIDYICIYINRDNKHSQDIISLTEENFGITPEIVLEDV